MLCFAAKKIIIGVINTLKIVHLNPMSVRPVAICKLPTGLLIVLVAYDIAKKLTTKCPEVYPEPYKIVSISLDKTIISKYIGKFNEAKRLTTFK